MTVDDFAPPAGVDVDPILKDLLISRSDALGDYLPVFDLLCHGQERLLDICCILGRGLQERDGQLIGKFLKKKKDEDGQGHRKQSPLPLPRCTRPLSCL